MQEVPNLNYIKELSGDAVEFEQKFITVLKEEFPEEARTYNAHFEKNELEMAAEVVHKLKHKFNILSMSEAYAFAVNYEEALRDGKTALHTNFLEFLDTIKNYLKTI